MFIIIVVVVLEILPRRLQQCYYHSHFMEEVTRAWEGEWLFQHLPTRKLVPEQGLEPGSTQLPMLMLYDLSKLLNSICTSPTENRKSPKFEDDLSLNVPLYAHMST